MKRFSTVSICMMLAAASGCSQPPAPTVAQAYADQFGAVESSRFTPCPKVQGVWQLGNLSAGSFLKEDGKLIQHFRWYAPQLFGLSAGVKVYIAIDPNPVDTVIYLTDKIQGAGGRNSLSYTTKSDKEMPCVGRGWRQVAVTDHSLNDAAARVLGLLPEQPVKITQTDYFAKTAANDLLLAVRIDFQGTNAEKQAVNDGYWHFLKMPRLHENPKEQGFRS
ncbi:MAG: hypothetical protein H7232_01945 [Aeromicrobium sp.]|nr:hypothetical protein [Burkholderiales bacterium]